MLQRKIEDFLACPPCILFQRLCTSTGPRLFLWWSRAAVVYLYVCMREDHLYIELIEKEKPTNTHTQTEKPTDAVVLAEQDCKEDFRLSRG